MRKRMVVGGALVVAALVGAQTIVDEMDHGDNTISWRIYDTKGTPVAFALEGGNLWYSIGTTVGMIELKTHRERLYPALGDMEAADITTIAGDRQGGVWFGGPGGAAVHRKGSFTVFTKDNGLPETAVQAIYGAAGDVWLGTAGGIARYQNGAMTVYTGKDHQCGNNVKDITADDKGNVYFATNKGIAVFTGSGWKKHDKSGGLSAVHVKALAYDHRMGVLWAAVGEQDINSFDGKEWTTYMEIQIGITGIMIDTQSRVWVGAESGVMKYNGIEWLTDAAQVGFPATVVNDMSRDAKGDLFFAVENGVLHMANPYPY